MNGYICMQPLLVMPEKKTEVMMSCSYLRTNLFKYFDTSENNVNQGISTHPYKGLYCRFVRLQFWEEVICVSCVHTNSY